MKLLAVPGAGFVENSVHVHRSDLMVVTDWVEGTALFFRQDVSKMEVRDFLYDEGYYQEQSFAMEFVEHIWGEVESRNARVAPHSAVDVGRDVIKPKCGWEDALGHAFCLMLAFLQRYSKKQHKKLHDGRYVQQGDLFERFSEESLLKLGWMTLRTGWASGISNPAFKVIIERVAQQLNEEWINDDAIPLFKDAKEEGLDLVVHMPFKDSKTGKAYFLVQCASGGNWEGKLHTPDLEAWRSLIVFNTSPRRGFCFPLAVDDDKFKKSCVRCAGMFLDRCRLLSSGTGMTDQLSTDLQAKLKQWLNPRVAALPMA